MKTKLKSLKSSVSSAISNLIFQSLFLMTFKKIPKKHDGRCVSCAAGDICYKVKVCKCDFNQQYDLRINSLIKQ